MAKHSLWRRKKQVKELDGGLTTAMSFAVVGSAEKFKPGFHAGKVFRLLKDWGAEVFPVAADVEKIGRDKVFANLLLLPQPVDVVVPCLPAPFTFSIVQEAFEAGIHTVWFQPKTLSPEAAEFCLAREMGVVEGCALKFQPFDDWLRFFQPCFWHGKTILRKQKYL